MHSTFQLCYIKSFKHDEKARNICAIKSQINKVLINYEKEIKKFKIYKKQVLLEEEKFKSAGINIIDPATTFIDSTVKFIGSGITINPNTHLKGDTKINSNPSILIINYHDCWLK